MLPVTATSLAITLTDEASSLRQSGKLGEARGMAKEAVSVCEEHVDWTESWRGDEALPTLKAVLTDLGDTAAIQRLLIREEGRRPRPGNSSGSN
jgi:hypothetical protein